MVLQLLSKHEGIEVRYDEFTQNISRIAVHRRSRKGMSKEICSHQGMCIFCEENIHKYVVLDIDGKEYCEDGIRIFKNKYPFSQHHYVLTFKDHFLDINSFKLDEWEKAFYLIESLWKDKYRDKVPHINMNFGISSGASQPHPHLQVMFSDEVCAFGKVLEKNKSLYESWVREHQQKNLMVDDFLFLYSPLGKNSIAFVSQENLSNRNFFLFVLSRYVYKVLRFYALLGVKAFNFSIFPTSIGTFSFFISREDPYKCYVNDFGFCESLLMERVVEYYPEDLASSFRNFQI